VSVCLIKSKCQGETGIHLRSYLPYNQTAKGELRDFGVLLLVSELPGETRLAAPPAAEGDGGKPRLYSAFL
jgi:hypothetical protein